MDNGKKFSKCIDAPQSNILDLVTSNFFVFSFIKNTVKMDLLEIGVSVMDWIGLAQDRYRWRALVNSVMNLRVP
jgi:hypothetical protein